MISFQEFHKHVSPAGFGFPRHMQLIGKHLDLVDRGAIKNLMIFTPPQHGKSSLVMDCYPARRFARNPLDHGLLCSYSGDLAERGSGNVLRTVQSDWWQEQYGYPVGKATNSRWQFNVPGQDGRYSCVASGISGSITGHTASFCVIDDVLRNRQDALSPTIRESIWSNYTSSVESRLPQDGNVVMITTRWHQDDLPGRLLQRAKENPKSSQWTVLVLPATNDSGEESFILNTATGEQRFLWKYAALWPEKFPREILDQRRADLGESLYIALYGCRPSMGTNVLFPSDKWTVNEQFAPVAVAQAWDCASKSGNSNDWSVCCTLGVDNTGRFKVLDVWRGKPDFHSLKRQVFIQWVAVHQKFGIQSVVVIEDANAGTQLLQEFEHLNSVNPSMIFPVAVRPLKNKFLRSEAIAGYQNAGQVALPADAPWRELFIRECEEFPLGQHDDQCDSYTWAQAAFVRGQGVFKDQQGPQGGSVDVYDALAEANDYGYQSSHEDLNDFDQEMERAESLLRYLK